MLKNYKLYSENHWWYLGPKPIQLNVTLDKTCILKKNVEIEKNIAQWCNYVFIFISNIIQYRNQNLKKHL